MKNIKGQKKTAKAIEGTFRKKRLSQAKKESLLKAQQARLARAQQLRMLQGGVVSCNEALLNIAPNELIKASPMLPKPINKAVISFISIMQTYLNKRRIETPNMIELPVTVICPHMFTVGASGIRRLF